jgi:hypothetical protein
VGRRKKPIDLGNLADEAQAALNYLYDQGYEKEVQAVRAYIVGQGEHFVRTQRTSREMIGDLTRKLLRTTDAEAS